MADAAELIRRQEAARAARLDREDLYLLMESYQNTITLNTTLLERQDILNANIERVIKELVTVCASQADIIAAVRAARTDEIKEHAGHNNRVYVALVGMVGIILTLIGLLVSK
jgi:hypothetical protein